MEFTAAQIASFLHGTVEGDPEASVSTFTKIEEGKPGGLSFLSNPKYSQYLYTTQASIVLINKDFILESPVSATLIRVDDAYASLAQLLQLAEQFKPKKKGIDNQVFIAESAQLDENVYVGTFSYLAEGVQVGEGTQIYPQVYLGENVHIGKNCILYPGVRIYHDCLIGDNCILHAGVVIGADGFGHAPQSDGTYKKIPQIGNVIVEDNVEICANTTVDRATMGSTIIHKGVKLDNLIQIAHNVEIGENTVMAAQSGIAGSTKIGRQCVIAGQVGVAGHLHIADGVTLAAQTGIISDVKSNESAQFGSPAMPIKDYLRSYTIFRKLPDLYKELTALRKELNELKKQDK